jgi:hypothetical protein
MKTRNGFVSNSSSSSFVITSKVSIEKVEKVMTKAWNKFLSKKDPIQNSDYYKSFNETQANLRFVLTDWEQTSQKEKKKLLIEWFGEMACWNPHEPLKQNFDFYCKLIFHFRPKFLRKFLGTTYNWLCGIFHGTYLSEAMKSKIYMIGKDNEVPYEVLQKLEKKFKKNIKIHYHMG